MTKITAKNAREIRDSFLKDLRDESDNPAGEANAEGATDIAASPEGGESTAALAGGGEGGETPSPGETGDPGAQTPASTQSDGSATPSGAQDPGSTPADPYASLSREELVTRLKNTEKQRASIQRIITPTQEQNARLREQVAALGKEVEALKKAGANATPPAGNEAGPNLDSVKEVFPELVPILEELMKRGGGSGSDKEIESIREELKARDEKDEAVRRARIVGQIEDAHPDARAIVASDGFLEWIDSHGAHAAVLRDQLENPWNYPPQATIDLFEGYKSEVLRIEPGQTAAPSPAPPPPAPPKVPTDVVPPSRPAPPVAPRASGAKAKLSDKERETLLRELRSGRVKDSRKQEIKSLLLAG